MWAPSEAVRSARYLAVTAIVGEVYNLWATAELVDVDLGLEAAAGITSKRE